MNNEFGGSSAPTATEGLLYIERGQQKILAASSDNSTLTLSDGVPTWTDSSTLGDMTLSGIQTNTGAKTFNSSTFKLAGSSSGTTIFNAAAAAGTTTIALPASSGTVALIADTHYIGTTSVALNRASANLTLTGISSIAFPGSGSGTAILQAAATAGTPTISLPAITGTLCLNPMTAVSDLIVGGISGAPTLLAKGTDGDVLMLVAGAISWEANAPTAGGTDTQIQYNDGGTTAGLANFTISKGSGMMNAILLTLQKIGTAATVLTARRGTAGQTEPIIQVQDQANGPLASINCTGSFSATLVNAIDDTAAATASVAVGEMYRNGSIVMIRVS